MQQLSTYHKTNLADLLRRTSVHLTAKELKTLEMNK